MVYDGIHDGELSPREFFTRLFAEADARDSRPLEDREYGRREFFAHLFGEGRERDHGAQCGGHGGGRRGGAAGSAEVGAASGGWGPLRFEIEAGANGLIARKREHTGGRTTTWDYAYDPRGRLAGVLRDGVAVEEYAYDRAGRRVLARTEATGGVAEGYAYDGDLLLRAGEESFAHADGGALAVCRGATGRTLFDYEPGGGLGCVELPDGRLVAYLANDLGQPLEKFVDGRRTERFRWRDPLRLSAYRDLERGVSMRFHYGPERLPRTVTVIDAQGERTLHLGYDQVGTLKAVADAHGHLIQTMEYDSFGNPLRDSTPALFIPLGFGGGLRDRHTGLVRLVRRDYDPRVGRFTAPDPLGDTGGDHDLFEYCVDDPVNAVDPTGEIAFALPLMFLAGKALAAGIAGLGVTVASQLTGNPKVKVKVAGKEKETTLNKAALAGVAASKVPDLAVAGALAAPEAAPAVARSAAAAKEGVKNVVKSSTEIAQAALKTIGKQASNPNVQATAASTLDAATGYSVPGPPPTTPGGYLGSGLRWVQDQAGRYTNKRQQQNDN